MMVKYETILGAGVKIIQHVYSSIVDKDTKKTRVDDVRRLLEMTRSLLRG